MGATRMAFKGKGIRRRSAPVVLALVVPVVAGLLVACRGDAEDLSGATMGDAGRMRPDSISGTIWQDEDGDGTISGNEMGMSDVAVSLWLDTDGDGLCGAQDELVASATTEPDGGYVFEGLTAGLYCVQAEGLWSDAVDLEAGGSLLVDVPLP